MFPRQISWGRPRGLQEGGRGGAEVHPNHYRQQQEPWTSSAQARLQRPLSQGDKTTLRNRSQVRFEAKSEPSIGWRCLKWWRLAVFALISIAKDVKWPWNFLGQKLLTEAARISGASAAEQGGLTKLMLGKINWSAVNYRYLYCLPLKWLCGKSFNLMAPKLLSATPSVVGTGTIPYDKNLIFNVCPTNAQQLMSKF